MLDQDASAGSSAAEVASQSGLKPNFELGSAATRVVGSAQHFSQPPHGIRVGIPMISEVTETKNYSEASSLGGEHSPAKSSDALGRKFANSSAADGGPVALAPIDQRLGARASVGDSHSDHAGSTSGGDASKSLTPTRPREMTLSPRHIVIPPRMD